MDSVLKIGGSGNHHLFLLLGKHLAEAATEGRHVSFRVSRVTDYSVAIVRDAKRDLNCSLIGPKTEVNFPPCNAIG